MSEASDDRKRCEPAGEEPERLMPRLSILSLIGLTTLAAVLFWVVRTGLSGNYVGMKAVIVVVVAAGACFATYAAMFSITYLLSLAMRPLVEAAGGDLTRPQAAVPTRYPPPADGVAGPADGESGPADGEDGAAGPADAAASGPAPHPLDADEPCASAAPGNTVPAADRQEDAS